MTASLINPESGLTFSSSSCQYPRSIAVLRDSTMTGFLVPCRLLKCSGCGDVRLNRATAGVWQTALNGECIFFGVVAGEHREALQKRVNRRGYLIRLFPTADGHCRFFTTDPREGLLILPPEMPRALTDAWQEMTAAKKRCGGSRAWIAPEIKRSMPKNQRCLGMSMLPIDQQAETLRRLYGDRLHVSFVDERWTCTLPSDVSAEVIRKRLGFSSVQDRNERLGLSPSARSPNGTG
jgi:hypothetical protein